jgi:YVTN family beta-propeller protein
MRFFKNVKWTGLVIILLMLGLVLTGTGGAHAEENSPARGRIVVANRGSGSISVIDAKTSALVKTVSLPEGENPSEPMYVVYSPQGNRVLVGDRANDRVVVFEARTLEIEASIPTDAGVFHMWGDAQEAQLWVAADIDKTITVIDLITLEVVTSIPIPADLDALGGKPHDVILDPVRPLAYVTILGVSGPADFVVQYSTETFAEIGRAAVGKDPHLSLTRQNDKLYVPAQNSDLVTVLDRESMAVLAEIQVPGAHGAGMRRDGKVFYTTNLPGGGNPGLIAIDTRTDQVISPATDTPYPVPHNLALTPDGRQLYVTHSGAAANKVTVYQTFGWDPQPVFQTEIIVGLNPFGLAYLP